MKKMFFLIVVWTWIMPASYAEAPLQEAPALVQESGTYVVEKVNDGRKIRLSNGLRVQLVGVSTPKVNNPEKNLLKAEKEQVDTEILEAFGEKAKAFLTQELQGKEIRVELDPENVATAHQNLSGQTLAYVFRAEDDFFANAEIISQGYGFAAKKSASKYKDQFQQYEQEAKDAGRGLWTGWTGQN